MIDMKDVKVSLTVVLRNNQEMLDIENFNGGVGIVLLQNICL